MSEGKSNILPSVMDDQSTKEPSNVELRDMVNQLLQSHSVMKSAIDKLSENSSMDSTSDRLDSPPDRRQTNRRTSLFFGADSASKLYVAPRPQLPVRIRMSSSAYRSPALNRQTSNATPKIIQVLQADIVYNRELKVSSLEGLTYLSKQLQLLSSQYPGREIKTAHMVAVSLRQHVVAAWNTHLNKQAVYTGDDQPEIMVNDWLSFDNEFVQEMLLEAARPRTREQYSQELVRFLLKAIPQSPEINTDNFSKIFFDPLMKSLQDLLQLHDLLSADTSNFSNNASKMPSTSYGTRENPGHIQLWIISLGSQKDAILQWLGKDQLQKHKTLVPAIKYIRSKLMEGRAHSEARQDFQHQLTPIKYEDIRKTQGESHQRQQVNFAPRPQHSAQSAYRSHDSHPRTSMAALDTTDNLLDSYDDSHDDIYDDSFNDHPSSLPAFQHNERHSISGHEDDMDSSHILSQHGDRTSENAPHLYENFDPVASYCAINAQPSPLSYRNAISATFRGYCSELFVHGKCSRRDSGCHMDHSAAAQERCIQSFALLTKRELSKHSDLPQWSLPLASVSKSNASSPYSDARSLRPQPSFIQPRTYGHSASSTGSAHNTSSTSRPYPK